MSAEQDDQYSASEIAERMGRALKRALKTQHSPQKPPKGKPGRPRKRVLTPRRSRIRP